MNPQPDDNVPSSDAESGYVRPVNRTKNTPSPIARVYGKFKWVGRTLIAGASSCVALGAYFEELSWFFYLIAGILFLPVPVIFAPAIVRSMYENAPKRFAFVVLSTVGVCVSILLYNRFGSIWYLFAAIMVAWPAVTVLACFVYLECKHEFTETES